jgi:hypothetical protein
LISALDPSTRSTFSANPEISSLLTSCLLPMFAWEKNWPFFFGVEFMCWSTGQPNLQSVIISYHWSWRKQSVTGNSQFGVYGSFIFMTLYHFLAFFALLRLSYQVWRALWTMLCFSFYSSLLCLIDVTVFTMALRPELLWV